MNANATMTIDQIREVDPKQAEAMYAATEVLNAFCDLNELPVPDGTFRLIEDNEIGEGWFIRFKPTDNSKTPLILKFTDDFMEGWVYEMSSDWTKVVAS